MKPVWLFVVAALMLGLKPSRSAAQPNQLPTPRAAILAAETVLGQRSIMSEDRRGLEKVRSILDAIVTEFPGSDAAAHILLEDKVGTIDVGELDRRLATMPPSPVVETGRVLSAETNQTLREELQKALTDLAAAQASKADEERKIVLLNRQLAAMRDQLGALQRVLGASASGDTEMKFQIENLGSQLNAALAQVAVEQRKLFDVETQKARLLSRQRPDLSGYRSQFFYEASRVMAGTRGIKVVGDRFVFSSDFLFAPGSAQLTEIGKKDVNAVASALKHVAGQIPGSINWILHVNGYTDARPLVSVGKYKDNWELSQAQALSIVRYMISQGFPPNRLSATGFGQYQPVAKGATPEVMAQNRRIELKLTTQ